MKITLLFLISLSLIACNSLKEENLLGKEIFFLEYKEPIEQLSLLQNKRYIPLETTKECLFTEITQLFCTSKEIFVFDLYTQSVYIFDYAGKFQRKLHKTGQGPGEYTMITAITVNENTHRISVVNLGCNILSYNIESLEFIDEQKIEAVAVEEDDEMEYFSYNSLPSTKNGVSYKHHIIKYDKEGNVEKTFLPIEFESGYIMRPIYRFYRNSNRLFTYLPYTSNVYEITKDTCVLYYTMKYENLSYPSLEYLNSVQKAGKNYVNELSNEKYIYNVQLVENKNFITSLFDVGRNTYLGVYNKKTDKGYYFPKQRNGELLYNIDYLQIISSHDDDFISVIKPTSIDKESEVMDKGLKNVLLTEEEDSNPILLFFQLKED